MKEELSRRAFAKQLFSASMIGALSQQSKANPVATFESSEVLQRGVRTKIERTIAAGGATGVAVAIVQDDRIVWSEGFGWADRSARVKVSPRTPFSMASITKPFTTTTLMALAEQQKFSLDGPANDALGSSRLLGFGGQAATCSVRTLGAHISGLPSMYESYEDSEVDLVRSPESLLTDYGRLAYPPASVYEYSNIGYAALHAIASAVTGVELGTLIRRYILNPLALNDSFFGSKKTRVSSGAARYDSRGHHIPHYVTSTPASGELYASAYDLARFLLFNMGRGLHGGAPVLRKESLEELHRSVYTGPSGIATTFGWFRGKTASGVPFFFKSGGDPGVANRICFAPTIGLGCVVLTNQSNATSLAYEVCDQIMRNQIPDWQQPEEYCGYPARSIPSDSLLEGVWHGHLENDRLRLPVRLTVRSVRTALLAIGDQVEASLMDFEAEGPTITGTISGLIDSPDSRRGQARKLQVKLFPYNGCLTGRVLALGGDPNFRNVELPYVLTLAKD